MGRSRSRKTLEGFFNSDDIYYLSRCLRECNKAIEYDKLGAEEEIPLDVWFREKLNSKEREICKDIILENMLKIVDKVD